MKKKSVLFIVLLLLTMGSTGKAFALEQVSLQLIRKHQFQFAGYYVAKEKGFYDEAGFDVDIKEYELGTNTTEDILSGKTEFAVGRSGLILDKMEGKAVFLMAAIYQHSPHVLLTRDRPDLKAVPQLKDKKIMILDDEVDMASLTAMFMAAGLTAGDYQQQIPSFNVDDLIQGKTDAVSAYLSNEPYQMQKRGVAYSIFYPKDYGFDFYSDFLFTSQTRFNRQPDQVERFYRASLRGWEYAFANIEETVDIILEKYNTQNRDREALLYEGKTLKSMAYDTGVPLGHINQARLDQIAQVYRLLGLTQSTGKVTDFYYVPKSSSELGLTAEEHRFLSNLGTVRVHNESAWAPYNFFENGKPRGYSIDYMNLVAEKLGLDIDYITGPTWDEFIAMSKKSDIDILLNIAQTPERDEFLNFTHPYSELVRAVYIREGMSPINSINDLYGKRVAVPKGFYSDKQLSRFPKIILIRVPDVTASIKAVALGDADALLDMMPVVQYYSQKLGINNVKLGGALHLEEGDSVPLRIGIRKDWPLMASIINKAMMAISDDDLMKIQNRWINYQEARQKPLGLSFTPEEERWLEKHKTIRVHNEMNWPPFNFNVEGKPTGLSIDYINLLAKRVGIEVEFVSGEWGDLLKKAYAKELDVMLNIVKTPERLNYLLYTGSYARNPNVIVSKEGADVSGIESLFGKRVSFPSGFFYEEILKGKYPQIKRVPVTDILASLKAVQFGEADAALGELAVVNYLIRNHHLSGLDAKTPFATGDPEIEKLNIAVRDDWPELRSILKKTMASIDDYEFQKLKEKWLITGSDVGASIRLSAEERAWLDQNPVLVVGNEDDWAPFDFSYAGEAAGYSIDLLKLMAEKIGIRLVFVNGYTWNQLLDKMRNKEIDLLPALASTPDRQQYMEFTDHYLENPTVIVTRDDNTGIKNIEDLFGRKLALVKGYYYVERIKQDNPEIEIVEVDGFLDGLQSVLQTEADAFIGSGKVVSYTVQKHFISGLKVVGQSGIDDVDLFKIRMGVQKGNFILVSLLNKAMAEISYHERIQIQQKWLPPSETDLTKDQELDREFSITRLIIFGIIVFIIFVAISVLFWIFVRIFKKENVSIRYGSKWFRWIVLAGLSLYLVITVLITWMILERNRETLLRDTENNLRGVLLVFQERLDLWLVERQTHMKQLGLNPELVSLTNRLLEVKPEKNTLLASEALADVRAFFKGTGDIFPNIGFFIINRDYISIGSMRDGNVGTLNLISKQYPDLLKKAFEGEVGFVPPITSDVHLGTSKGDKKPPTMFYIGPIRDQGGSIIAVFTLRVDPWRDFSKYLSSLNTLKSGEVYAFDINGNLLTPSRFENQLRRIGLLAENEKSAMNIEIRDPGVNLVEGKSPKLERTQQPLTYMVQKTIELQERMIVVDEQLVHSGIKSSDSSYRDYRGVPVYGAWLWNHNLNLGLAAEIDVDEALELFYQTRFMVRGILGFTLFLSIGAVLLVLLLGERASRALIRARDNLETEVENRTAELQANQERLKSAEERSRLLLESVGEGIFGVSTDGTINFINPSALSQLGYTENEIIGQAAHPLIHHSHADGSYYDVKNCPMYHSFTYGKSGTITDEVLWRKDGSHFDVQYSSTPMMKDNQIVGAVITFLDVTERKTMEENLAMERERLQQILDTSPVGVAFSTQGNIHFANPRFTEMFGAKPGDKSPDLYVNIKDRETLVNMLKTEGKAEGYELQMYGADRRIMDMLVTYLPITIDGEEGILGWLLDITDRKQMEQALEIEKTQLQQILDTSPVGVGITVSGVLRFANPKILELLDFKLGDSSEELYVYSADRDYILTELKNHGIIEGYELQMYGKNKELKDMLVTFMNITYEGEDAILAWIMDITDLKKVNRELTERFDELSRFRRLAVGRELKMIEIKKEINELLIQLDKKPRYKIVDSVE